MRSLALYPGPQSSPVELQTPVAYDNVCVRCPLGLVGGTTCMKPAGSGPGGVLVVVDQPSAEEDKAGQLCRSDLHQLIAAKVHRHARRPFLVDAAVKCHAGRVIDQSHVEACRPYLWRTMLDARPDRVIVTGQDAVRAVLGRSPMLSSVRRGYGWLWDAPWADPVTLRDGRVVRPVPVFLTMPLWLSRTNAFYRDWLDADVAWACTTPVPQLPPWDGVTQVIETAADAELAAAVLGAAEWVTFDVETSGRMHAGEIMVVSLAMCTDQGESYVWDRAALADHGCLVQASSLLEDETVRKVAQVAKFDLQALEQGLGVKVRNLHGDTRIWRKQLDTESLADLETMSELVGMGGSHYERVVAAKVNELVKEEGKKAQAVKRSILKAKLHVAEAIKGTKDQVEVLLSKFGDELTDEERAALWRGYVPRAYVYGDVPIDDLSAYNATDVVITAAVARHLKPQLVEQDLLWAWECLSGPAMEALVQVETWGFPVDLQQIKLLSRHFGAQLDVLRQRFAQYGEGFNPSSDDQVRDLLFNRLKLKPVSKSEKTGEPSTNKGTLDALKGEHPVIEELIEYRHIAKLKSQYADGMILHVAPDGRIHTTYNLDGARSWRISSENPNMQNIPSEERDPVDSKMVKDCFVARPGYVLVYADYKQLEFRVAADLADDRDMKAVFLAGHDFHTATAAFIAPIVWRVNVCSSCIENLDNGTPCHLTKAHRRGAKSFNFGIMYGMLDSGIAERAGCSMADARAIRAAVLGKFKRFAAWIQECLAYTRKTGHAWTYWEGRRAHKRELQLVKDQDQGRRINAENSTYNSPVQGTASFYILATVTAMTRWILDNRIDAKVVATVHDSIVLEVRQDLVRDVARKLRAVATSWPTMTGVPLDIDLKTGLYWGSLTGAGLPEAEAAGVLGGPEAVSAVLADLGVQ